MGHTKYYFQGLLSLIGTMPRTTKDKLTPTTDRRVGLVGAQTLTGVPTNVPLPNWTGGLGRLHQGLHLNGHLIQTYQIRERLDLQDKVVIRIIEAVTWCKVLGPIHEMALK